MALSLLVNRIYAVHALQSQIRRAEKSQLPMLLAEAKTLFSQCIQQFDNCQWEANFEAGPFVKDHAELVVGLAEAAIFTENFDAARRLVVNFFMINPQEDQYYCRARIVLGLVINFETRDLKGIERIQGGELAMKEMIKALDIAVASNNIHRYKFIVYNVSISAWAVVRPFLRSGRAKSFANAFQQIVNALEQQDDSDKDWRIMLLSAAAICFDDAANAKAASDNVDKAIGLIEALIADTTAQQLLVDKELSECKKDVDAAMSAFRAIEEREELLCKPRKIDPDLSLDDPYYTAPLLFPPLQGLAAEGKERVKDLLDLSQAKRTSAEQRLRVIIDRKSLQSESLLRLCKQRIAVNVPDAKKFATGPSITKDLRLNSLSQLQCIVSGAVSEKELDGAWSGIIKKLEDSPVSDVRAETLLDVARAAWGLRQSNHALRCQAIVQRAPIGVSQILRIKTDVCEGLKEAHAIGEAVVTASRQNLLNERQLEGLVVTKRIEVVKMMERTLNMAVQVACDKFLVHEICVLLWNMLIPLLTDKFRPRVHSALKSLCVALEAVAGVAPELRCHLHYELSLCEEAADFASLALVESGKAYWQDFGLVAAHPTPDDRCLSLDLNRPSDQYLLPWLQALSLRIDVFASPAEADAQALLWLQQAKESSSKPFVRDMCTKAAALLFDFIDDLSGGRPTDPSAVVGGAVDWSLVLMRRGALEVARVPLSALDELLRSPVSTKSVFSFPLQRKLQLLMALAKLAHAAEELDIVQQACIFILRHTWDVGAVWSALLIDDQIEAACLLAETFVPRIHATARGVRKGSGNLALGVEAKDVPAEVMHMKQLAVLALEHALALALSRGDPFSVHNVLIFFWNLHLHVFRSALFDLITEDLARALGKACAALEAMLSFPEAKLCFDLRLFVSVFDSAVALHEARGQLSEALELATKCLNTLALPIPAGASSCAFFKKSLCERASRMQVVHALKGGAAPSGGKGKGGGAAVEPFIVIGNPLLQVFSCLAVADMNPALCPGLTTETLADAQAQAIRGLREESANQLQAEEKEELTSSTSRTRQEVVQQRLELRLEAQARLARLLVMRGDFITGQDAAAEGIRLFNAFRGGSLCVGSKLSAVGDLFGDEDEDEDEDEQQLQARVYRWASMCEQGSALSLLAFLDASLAAPGSASFDPALITELQLLALTHVQPAARYAVRSGEGRLVGRAVILAQSILAPLLLLDGESRSRAFHLGMQIVVDLHKVSLALDTQTVLRSIYLALAQSLMATRDYDSALKLVTQAFDHVDSSLHRELWPPRVVCMSKKGLNVLDGLQKLKEKDPVMQAQVLVLFARATSDLAARVDAYQQAISLLEGRLDRVDYLLELAEVVATEGLPSEEVRVLLRSALDALCEVEEQRFEEVRDWEDGDDEELGADRSTVQLPPSRQPARSVVSMTSKRRGSNTPSREKNGDRGGSKTPSQAGPASVKGSQSGLSVTAKSDTEEPPPLPEMLDFKSLEQSMRLHVMLLSTESRYEERTSHLLSAYYFLRRAVEVWVGALDASATENEGHSSPPFVLPDDPALLVRWPEHLAFCRRGRQVSTTAPLLVPSATSLPLYTATAQHLEALVDALEQAGLLSKALYVVAILRLIVCSRGDLDDGAVALLAALHVRATVLCLRMGLPADYLANELFVPTADLSVSKAWGPFMEQFIARNAFEHTRADISADILLDVSFRDVLSAVGDKGSVFRPSIFVDTCPDLLAQALDADYYWLRTCEGLATLGQFATVSRLSATVLWRLRAQRKPRAVAQAAAMLGQAMLMCGFADEVAAWLIAQRDVLRLVGDPVLLSAHIRVLVSANLQRGQLQEAHDSALLLLQLLRDLAVRRLEATQQPNNNTKSGAKSSSLGVAVSATSYYRMEVGWEYLRSLKDAAVLLAQVLQRESSDRLRDASSRGTDPRDLVTQAVQHLDSVAVLIRQHCGPESPWLSELEEARVGLSVAFVVELHQCKPSLVAIEGYEVWLRAQLRQCVDTSEEMLARTTRSMQRIGVSSGPLGAAVGGTPGEPGTWSFHAKHLLSVDGLRSRPVPSPTLRITSLSQISLASQYLLEDSFLYLPASTQPESARDAGDAEGDDPICAYLEQTAPPTLHSAQTFRASSLSQAAQLSSAALLSLDPRSGDASLLRAKIVYLAAQVLQCRRQGDYDFHRNGLGLAAAIDWRDALDSAVRDAVDTDDSDLRVLLPHSIMALIEAFWCGQDFHATGRLILLLQSLKMRTWLRSMWMAALPHKCEVFAAQERLRLLRCQRFADVEALPQYQADKAFILRSSTAARRLSIAADVEQALQALPLGAAVICLQSCPWQRTLYVAATIPQHEIPQQGGAGAPGGKGAPKDATPAVQSASKRIIDKMTLTEVQRRHLEVLLDQQRVWRQDALRFGAQFCEDLPADADLEDAIAVSSERMTLAQKAERALEERLRALTEDLETLLSPVLGRNSMVGAALIAASSRSGFSCVLLVDPWLQSLPFEGLELFDGPEELQQSRDFSVHVLAHRVRGLAANTSNPSLVTASNMRMVIDPWQDDALPASKTASVLKGVVGAAAGGTKWMSVRASELGVVGTGDILHSFDASVGAVSKSPLGFFAFSLGRLGTLLTPAEVAVANLERLQVLLCIDTHHNDCSFRRQNSVDVVKSVHEVMLEDPLVFGALLSLCGASTVLLQTWSTPYRAQLRFATALLQHWTVKREQLSVALRSCRSVPCDDRLHPAKVKKWIRIARVLYGIPAVGYQDM